VKDVTVTDNAIIVHVEKLGSDVKREVNIISGSRGASLTSGSGKISLTGDTNTALGDKSELDDPGCGSTLYPGALSGEPCRTSCPDA